MEGEWGNSGHSTRDVGRGGLWQDVVEENGTNMGQSGRKMGRNTHESHTCVWGTVRGGPEGGTPGWSGVGPDPPLPTLLAPGMY